MGKGYRYISFEEADSTRKFLKAKRLFYSKSESKYMPVSDDVDYVKFVMGTTSMLSSLSITV